MENLKQLLNDKKYDEAIKACADDSSYEQLTIKALALMYKREYTACADMFVQAVNITKDFDIVTAFVGVETASQLFDEMGEVFRAEAREGLERLPDDNSCIFKFSGRLKEVYLAMGKIVEAANQYEPSNMPVYNLSLFSQFAITMTIASDTQNFIDDYFKKVSAVCGNNAPKTTIDTDVPKQSTNELENISTKASYITVLSIQVAGLLNIVINSNTKEKYLDEIKSLYHRVIETMRKTIDLHAIDSVGNSVLLFKHGSERRKSAISNLGKFELSLKDLDPEYQPKPLPLVGQATASNPTAPKTTSANNSGGCYVATAVYGSYDCPEVWTLRRFRDNVLSKNVFGRTFVYIYYAISPTLVKFFGNTKWFKKLCQKPLDKMVAKLNAKGTENTPYDDIAR